MFVASVIAHIALGCVLGWFFVVLYINGDGKAKLFYEILLGLGGNAGAIFVLYNTFKIEDITINLISIASCLFSFLLITLALLVIFAHIIKDKENEEQSIIRLRDIIVGQTSWIKLFRDKRMKEIDESLNYDKLKQREEIILKKERDITEEKKFICEELKRINELGNKKLKILLPENRQIVVSESFLDAFPSYISDFSKCINTMKALSDSFIENNRGKSVTKMELHSYFLTIASCVSTYLFGANNDVRVHFRYYNENTQTYDSLVLITGRDIKNNSLTPIPYDKPSMIQKSFECKRCLIKSVNTGYDYQSNNYTKWKDYMTYTFYNLLRNGIPYLTFGISVKNAARYKDIFYFLGFVEIETSMNEYIENVAFEVGFEQILYGEVG